MMMLYEVHNTGSVGDVEGLKKAVAEVGVKIGGSFVTKC